MDINTVIGDINALVAESVQAAQAPLTAEVTRLNALIVSRDATIAARDATIIQITNDFNAYKLSHPDAPAGDTTPPSAPTNLVATVVSTSAINLAWSASTDNVGVTGYDVYRNNVLIGSRVGTSYADSGLTASTTYSYSVKAKDAAGNISNMSTAVTAKTSDVVTPPSGFVWPSASTTGVPAGTTLTPYTGPQYIQTANTVITGKTITQGLEIAAVSGVTFRKCKFTGNSTWGLNGDKAKDLVIEDCEFSGFQKAILGQGTFTRLNIHNVTIGITLKGGKSTIKGCYIHDLTNPAGLADPHYDCIFMGDALRDCLVEDNFLTCPADHGTSNVFIATQGYGNGIFNTTVNHNRMLGKPSAGMYVVNQTAPVTGTKITNNEIERGNAGYWIIQNATAVRTGNVDAFTGANIDNQ